MQCAFHPSKKATTACSTCLKLLCEECAISQKNDQVICSGCAEQQVANHVIEEIQQREQKRVESRHIKEARKKRQMMIFRMVFVSFVAIILIANGYMFFKRGGNSGNRRTKRVG